MSDIPEQHQACGTEMEAMQCPDRSQRQTEDIHGVGQYASVVVGIDRRLSAAWRAFEGAATSDQEAAKLYGVMVEQRRHAMREPAQLFADAGALRADLDIEVAADLMWFYNDPSLYDKLVRQRGWSVDRFQAWLTEALQVQLLGKAPSVHTAE
jgi:TetR/AcrR family transcriptional regulator, regulator of autoinduction and epiphytic fitness